ncbi:hypothetical protein ACFFKU_02935 [Kineococcus gynurae]|uniref:DUF3040 family protein n=1 Tax=Kineococcus gynurae TaxID=452979 RepID=A0ABV5LS90_9ACTN
MAVVGPELSPTRRHRAIRAYQALPAEDRREVLALARQGRRHPDERVMAVAWWYAAAVLQPRWWNRMPVWLLPVLAFVLLTLAVVGDLRPLAVLAFGVLVVGVGLGWQRLATLPVLVLMRAPEAGDVPDGVEPTL